MSQPVVYIALQQFCEYDEQPLHQLRVAGCDVRRNALGRRMGREELREALQDADAVVAGVEPYDAELLKALPRLRCISRCGVGTDSIDLEAARQQGVVVYTTTEEVVEPVAQMTITMILALARNIPRHLADVRGGRWKKWTGALLSEWTIGLVGFGRIGRSVERYLAAFAPRVLVADPRLRSTDVPDRVQLRELGALLAESNLVSLHASRQRGQGVLIGRQELSQMKRGAYLVNTARGFLVDEGALYDTLISGHLAGAALDVFEHEPYAGPLAGLPQVLCTPHVSSLARASRVAMEWRCAQHILEHFSQNQKEGS